MTSNRSCSVTAVFNNPPFFSNQTTTAPGCDDAFSAALTKTFVSTTPSSPPGLYGVAFFFNDSVDILVRPALGDHPRPRHAPNLRQPAFRLDRHSDRLVGIDPAPSEFGRDLPRGALDEQWLS